MICIFNSAILALGAVGIALPVGIALALLIARFDIAGRRVAMACLGVLLFLPLYVQLSAWDAALGKLGWLTLAYGSFSEPFLSGMRGAIFVHGMAAIPWVAVIVGIGLTQIDPTQEEAASLVAPPRVVLWKVTLPQTLAFIAAAALSTVAGTIADMTVTNIYLINPAEWTLTERFYMSWSLNLSPASRFDLLLGLVALSLACAFVLWLLGRSIRCSTMAARAVCPRLLALGSALTAVCLWLMIALLLGLPLVNLVSKAGFTVIHEGDHRVASWSIAKCAAEVAASPARYAREIGGTVETAACAASLAVACTAAMAWQARGGGVRAALALAVVILAIAFPGPLVGIGLIGIFNHDLPPRIALGEDGFKSWLLILYDNTPVAPIIAQMIRALPLVIVLIWNSFATLNNDVLAAAALDGLSPRRVFWKVGIPQRWPAIAAAWLLAFAIAAGDLAWCHLVTPPGLDLLSRRIFGLVHSGVEEQVAAISLVIVAAYFIVAFVALWLLSREQRIESR